MSKNKSRGGRCARYVLSLFYFQLNNRAGLDLDSKCFVRFLVDVIKNFLI